MFEHYHVRRSVTFQLINSIYGAKELRMDWRQAIAFGATGGLIVELINLWGNLISWQSARHAAREKSVQPLPSIKKYIDVLADTLVALTRVALGAGAGWVFHDQVTGTTAAIAVGASAPAVLAQLATARSFRQLVQGVQ